MLGSLAQLYGKHGQGLYSVTLGHMQKQMGMAIEFHSEGFHHQEITPCNDSSPLGSCAIGINFSVRTVPPSDGSEWTPPHSCRDHMQNH